LHPRSLPRAEALAEEFPEVEFDIRLMHDLLPCIEASDVIFAASGSEELLVQLEDVAHMPPASDKVRATQRGAARQGPTQVIRSAVGGHAQRCSATAAPVSAAPTRPGRLTWSLLPRPPPLPLSQVGGFRRYVDISVPRNIDPNLNALETAIVYNVDDLKEASTPRPLRRAELGKETAALPLRRLPAGCAADPALPPPLTLQVVCANKEQRAIAAAEAEILLVEEQLAFEAWRDSLETVPTIKALRSKAENIRAVELEKTLNKLGEGLTNKQKKVRARSLVAARQLVASPPLAPPCPASPGLPLTPPCPTATTGDRGAE
jgi:hypothetical protein